MCLGFSKSLKAKGKVLGTRLGPPLSPASLTIGGKCLLFEFTRLVHSLANAYALALWIDTVHRSYFLMHVCKKFLFQEPSPKPNHVKLKFSRVTLLNNSVIHEINSSPSGLEP